MATAIMKQKEVPEMDDVEEIISKISEDSPYKRRPTQKRTWMTVPEMGKLLGLKKTDRYWLVHKNVFESKEIAGKIRINIASFEKWYANQIKYHKVTGEEPGKELKSWSYSVKEVADLLGVDEYLVYDLLKKNQMEAVIVDYWKRIPKESFQNWYKSQSRYRTKEDRKKDALLEDATITMPEMAQLLGTTRSAVYTILDNPKYSHFFEFIVIAEKKRITKESFRKFLEGQDRYKLDPSNDYEELAQEQNIALANFRRKKLSQTGIRGSNGNIKYLTFDEASYLAKVSRSMINKWADKGKFTVIKVGSRVRIRRDEFEDWMEQRDFLFTCFLVTVQMGKGDTGKSRDDDCNGFAYLPAPATKKSREGHPKIDDSHDGECARSGSYRRGGEFDECFQVPSSIRPLSAFFAWHFS